MNPRRSQVECCTWALSQLALSAALGASLLVSQPSWAGPNKKKPSPRPETVNACPNGGIRLSDGSCAESGGVKVLDKTVHFEATEVEGQTVRPSGDYILGRYKPKFECELDQFETADDYLACVMKTLPKPFEEAAIEVADEFTQTMNCPEGKELESLDLAKLRRIGRQYDFNPKNEDISDLIVYPIDSGSPDFEAHLPVLCGYSSSYKKWFRTNFFCISGTECLLQGNQSVRKDYSKFTLLTNEANFWKLTQNRSQFRSYRDGGDIGDLRLAPLGRGVYLYTIRSRSEPYSFGLIITPTPENFLALACKREVWLNKTKKDGTLDPESIADAQGLIDGLVEKSKLLTQIRKLTAELNSEDPRLFGPAAENLSESRKEKIRLEQETRRASLKAQAQALLERLSQRDLAGRNESGETACQKLMALSAKRKAGQGQ